MGQYAANYLTLEDAPNELRGIRIPLTRFVVLRIPEQTLVATDAHITVTSDGLFPTEDGASCAVLSPILIRIPVRAFVLMYAHTAWFGLRWRVRLQCTIVLGLRTLTKALSEKQTKP